MSHHDVALITTGGTIDKYYPPDKGSYAFVFGRPAALAILETARVGVDSHIALPPKDSMDMTSVDRQNIAIECELLKHTTIVITHGTDTLIDTARVIAARQLGKVIVLVGAAQPECMKNTDANFNLGFAFGVAQALPSPGVYIAMNGEVFNWEQCVKLDDGTFVSRP